MQRDIMALPAVSRMFARGPALAAGAVICSALACALVAPVPFLGGIGLATAGAALLLALAFPIGATACWLLAAGTMPDMWLDSVLGVDSQTIIAVTKVSGLVLAGCCALRWCLRADPFTPILAYLAMFALGVVHGLPSYLPLSESVRSLLGSAAPFAFSCAYLPRRWSRCVARVTQLVPLFALLLGLVLGAAGVRPLFTGESGIRLAGPGHPAFLAGFALAGIWASLLALFIGGRRRDMVLLALNFAILVLTGARAPLAIACAVTLLALLLAPSAALPARARVPIVLAGVAGAVGLMVLAEVSGAIRILGILRGEEGGLSGRDLMWPYFRDAWSASPWVGWGVGAGKELVPVDAPVAKLLGTNAAHNEYLRIGVDGGWFGLVTLIGSFVLWTWWHTRRLPRTEQVILRLIMAGFAVHAYTDNVLIATTASVLFTWMSAAFAGGAGSLARGETT
jgi:O-antigen ligase